MTTYSPVDQSTPATTFGPSHEIFNAINSLQKEINELHKKYESVSVLAQTSEVLCMAYKDLHTKRIIFLLMPLPVMLLAVSVILWACNYNFEEFGSIIKTALFGSAVALIIEAFWFPNKIKEMDRQIGSCLKNNGNIENNIKEIESKIDGIDKKYTSLKKSIDPLTKEISPVKKRNPPKK
ncbi:MAG: hypothetical protein C4518_16095 [Desulfobacteraceae bacterium]|nr:MAG: hypothetical protein C4518_16095 [Desulfobacteraceae bacterium]